MELWLRYRNAHDLIYDETVDIGSEKEWLSIVYNPDLISSVLWPSGELFPIGGAYFHRRHPHEKNYRNNSQRNQSYRAACEVLAQKLSEQLHGLKCLFYLPLRGALPIWQVTKQFLDQLSFEEYYPVTSSFVFFPQQFGIRNRKGRNASGRYNNILELKRIRPFLSHFDCLVYLDEIVSGGMMKGYLNDMITLKINQEIPIIAAGLADSFGQRSQVKRTQIEHLVSEGVVQDFIWSGCTQLITEDQKYLLGIHYRDYTTGPHVIPVLSKNYEYYEEKKQFEADVLLRNGETLLKSGEQTKATV